MEINGLMAILRVKWYLRISKTGTAIFYLDAENEIVTTFYFRIGEDPTYARIDDGKWLNDEPYGVVDGLAGSGRVLRMLDPIVYSGVLIRYRTYPGRHPSRQCGDAAYIKEKRISPLRHHLRFKRYSPHCFSKDWKWKNPYQTFKTDTGFFIFTSKIRLNIG